MGKDIKIKGMDKVTGADDEICLTIFHPQSGVGEEEEEGSGLALPEQCLLQARHELRQGLYRQRVINFQKDNFLRENLKCLI